MMTANEINQASQQYKFNAEVDKILHMVIHSIYTNKEIFLRELISNGSDACDKWRCLTLQRGENLDDNFFIKIEANKEKGTMIIEDNGIGMTKQDLIDNLGTIASSGTQKFLQELADKKDQYLIGQFGVGFYAAFMVADRVQVYTTSALDNSSYLWESNGKDGFSIEKTDIAPQRGTRIHLYFKPSEVDFLDEYRIRHLVKTYSDHIAFPIHLLNDKNEDEVINSASALWMKPKSEISEKEYEEFYHHLSHMPGKPWMTFHHKAEGNIEYTSLLYVPDSKPYDLFHPDRKTRIKLYIKRVFIAEEGINLVPSYLRFLKGIIDSEDLPLNISRETLQNNAIVNKIRKAVVNKFLRDLKKKAENDKEEFNKFWQNFGEVMKEGLCEPALEEKEQLLDVCRFYSLHSQNDTISLKEYIDNMLEEQKEIYFINGNNLDSLKQNPHLEGFKKRGIDVLLFKDHVDDFWTNVIPHYQNKELKSIISSNIDLNTIKKLDDEKKDEENNENNSDQNQDLVKYIASVLGERVKKVEISNKLVDSPACLAIPEGAMNVRMERILMEQKQLNKRSSKILQINPSHPIMIEIAKEINKNNPAKDIIDLVEVIFDQARLVEGEEIENPCDFANKINKLLLKVHL